MPIFDVLVVLNKKMIALERNHLNFGSLEGAVSYSVSTNKTDGRVLHCQTYIILKRHA
jgi:hypothetical protein